MYKQYTLLLHTKPRGRANTVGFNFSLAQLQNGVKDPHLLSRVPVRVSHFLTLLHAPLLLKNLCLGTAISVTIGHLGFNDNACIRALTFYLTPRHIGVATCSILAIVQSGVRGTAGLQVGVQGRKIHSWAHGWPTVRTLEWRAGVSKLPYKV